MTPPTEGARPLHRHADCSIDCAQAGCGARDFTTTSKQCQEAVLDAVASAQNHMSRVAAGRPLAPHPTCNIITGAESHKGSRVKGCLDRG